MRKSVFVSGPLPTYAQTRGGPDTQVIFGVNAGYENIFLQRIE